MQAANVTTAQSSLKRAEKVIFETPVGYTAKAPVKGLEVVGVG